MELPIVVARRSWLEISMWKTGEDRKKEREHTRKKRDGIRTAELNRRDQVTAIVPGPVPSKGGTEVDNQVAAPTELRTPTMHRAKIAQPRARMEGWRQRRPGSNGRNPQEGKEKKEKNTLDSYRPSHGRHLEGADRSVMSCLSRNWRKRSSVKIAERTYEKRAKALHRRREGFHPEAAFVG